MFLIRTFFPDPDITFFLSPDPYRPKIRIQSGIFGSGSMKKNSKTVEQVENFVIFIFSTLNTILFGQVRPKPNLKTSFRSHLFVNGWIRIRVFKVRILIQIGEKTLIHPDPKHWKYLKNIPGNHVFND